MQRLHPATIILQALEFLRNFIWTFVVLFFSARNSDRVDQYMEIGFAVLGLFGVVASVYRYLNTRYGILDGVLTIKSGLFWRQERTIPLDRIQNVTLRRSLVERVFRVSTVLVETASGAGAEASLSSLSESDANELRLRLMRTVAVGESFRLEDAPLYEVSTAELVKAGALQNRALWIVVSVLGLTQFGSIRETLSRGARMTDTIPYTMRTLLFIGLGIGVILVGWMASIGASIIKYYGFQLRRHEKGLQVVYGLLTHVEYLIPIRRVQSLEVSAPMLYRLFGFREVRATTLGSFDEKSESGTVKLSPIVDVARVNRLTSFVFANLSFEHIDWKPVSRLTITRAAIRHFVEISVILILLTIFWRREAAWLWVVELPAAIYFGILRYRFLGYRTLDHYFAVRHGFWRQEAEACPYGAIQWVAVNSDWFQRRLGLASVEAHTAAGVLNVVDLPLEEALALQNELQERSLVAPRAGV